MELSAARRALVELARGGRPDDGQVRLETEGSHARLILDHPRAHHALTPWMMVDLADAVQALVGRDDVSTLLLTTSTPADPARAFCAGGHLRDVRSHLTAPGAGRAMALAMGSVLGHLADLPVVSVAAVGGAALGGGAELLTAVDARVLRVDARVGFVQASLGVAAGWGGALRLVRLVGDRRAARWLTVSRSMDASALGDFVDEVTTDSPVMAALDWLAPVRAHPVAGVRAAKAQVVAARPSSSASAALEAQAALFETVWGGSAHREALARTRQGRRR